MGLSLVIASACVFNNVADREIDVLMDRTKSRAVPAGRISASSAQIFGACLGIIGCLTVGIFANVTALLVAILGWVIYVYAYTPAKKKTVHATLIGTISGATPPVVGYSAVTNNIDGAAILLFLILVFWQMAHFYSIAIYRLSDYRAASIPVMPLKKGVKFTTISILLYLFGFIIAGIFLWLGGYTSLLYLVIFIILSTAWLVYGVKGLGAASSKKWARQMFHISLIVIAIFSAELLIDGWLK